MTIRRCVVGLLALVKLWWNHVRRFRNVVMLTAYRHRVCYHIGIEQQIQLDNERQPAYRYHFVLCLHCTNIF